MPKAEHRYGHGRAVHVMDGNRLSNNSTHFGVADYDPDIAIHEAALAPMSDGDPA